MNLTLPAISSGKTILVMSDDSLNIFAPHGGGYDHVASVAWAEENFVDIAVRIIEDDCKKKPIMILNDMVEQHYRKERVPKVGIVDQAQVLERRLKVTFQAYPIRAAIASKADAQAKTDKGGKQGSLYLFCALPVSDQLKKLFAVIRSSSVSVSGFGLLPIESAQMVHKLAHKFGGEEPGKTQWSVFIGQHRNGGIRQVVTRNGELALTRMTAIAATDSASWAKDVAEEFRATMSYLSRFGLANDDILDITIVSDESAVKHLEAMIETQGRLHVVTLKQAADAVGVNLPLASETHYADILHIAFAAKKPILSLPIKVPQITQIALPRQGAMAASFLLFLAFLYFGYEVLGGSQKLLELNADKKQKEIRLQTVMRDYEYEVKRKEELGFDIVLIQNSLDTYAEFKSNKLKIIPIIRSMKAALGPSMRLDALRIQQKPEPGRRGSNNDDKKKFEALMRFSFSENVEPDVAVSEVNKLRDRMQSSFRGGDVRIIKQAFDMTTSESFGGRTGELSKEEAEQQDLIAEIEVSGVIQ